MEEKAQPTIFTGTNIFMMFAIGVLLSSILYTSMLLQSKEKLLTEMTQAAGPVCSRTFTVGRGRCRPEDDDSDKIRGRRHRVGGALVLGDEECCKDDDGDRDDDRCCLDDLSGRHRGRQCCIDDDKKPGDDCGRRRDPPDVPEEDEKRLKKQGLL